jgi:hypothetical protein
MQAKAKECLGRELTWNDIVMPYGNKLEGLGPWDERSGT